MGNCIARCRLAEGHVRIPGHEVVAAAGPRSPILVGQAFLTLGPRLEHVSTSHQGRAESSFAADIMSLGSDC